MSVGKLDNQILVDLIKLSKYEAFVDIGKYRVYFDLSNGDDVARAEMFVYETYKGMTHDIYRKCAILATSIKRFGNVEFEEEESNTAKFSRKFNLLKDLQQPIIDFLWTTYLSYRNLQEKEFEEFLKNGKKS